MPWTRRDKKVIITPVVTVATATVARAVVFLTRFLPFEREICEAMGRTEVTATMTSVVSELWRREKVEVGGGADVVDTICSQGSWLLAKRCRERCRERCRGARDSTNRSVRLPRAAPIPHVRHDIRASTSRENRDVCIRSARRMGTTSSSWSSCARMLPIVILSLQPSLSRPWGRYRRRSIAATTGAKARDAIRPHGRDSSRFAYRER